MHDALIKIYIFIMKYLFKNLRNNWFEKEFLRKLYINIKY